MDRVTARTAESSNALVSELFQAVMGAGEGSIQALEELSGIAIGGHEEAKELIDQIDEATASGELSLPWPVIKESTAEVGNKRVMMPPDHPIF